jgi:hypothetical protein
MLATRHAAILALPILLSLVVSCGARSGLTEPISSCPEPASAVPDPGSLTLECGAYETFQVTLHNQCAETIWPAWTRTGGFDLSVLDPSFWAPLSPGESHDVTIYYCGSREIALWGRTRCSFDEQGQGACETGDCGGFVCPIGVNNTPNDATTYNSQFGFHRHYNVPMRVTKSGCEARQCSFDLDECSDASRVVGACGVASCSDVCPSASECCHMYANGCLLAGDIDLTFCP